MRFQSFSKKHLLVVLLVCSLGMILAGPERMLPLRHAAQAVLAPLNDAPMYATTSLARALSKDRTVRLTLEQSRQIEAENRFLRKLADHWQAQSKVYENLARRLQNFTGRYGPVNGLSCELMPARVLGTGSLAYDRSRILSAGTRQGVRASSVVVGRVPLPRPELVTDLSKALPSKLAVVTERALVGRVVDSGAFTARMMLLTDRDFQMTGVIRRAVVPGKQRIVTITQGGETRETQLTVANNVPIEVLVTGDGAGHVIVPEVKAYHNVLPGDNVWASTKNANVPVELYIGQVEKVMPSPEAKDAHRVRVIVRPYEDLTDIRDVFIINPLTPPPGSH